jgi:threonylcarbamoyladenosine tRNA methylthiotransferase MtaB
MKVYFHTLGCKVNRYETEKMLSDLESIGFAETKKAKEADLMVVNSCVVTHTSEQKTRQLTRKLKRENPNGILLLTGCMPQAFPFEAEKLPTDIILGNSSNRDIVGAVTDYLKNHTPIVSIEPHKKGETFEKGCLEKFSERTRAYMKIEDGCDRCCTYCIIPKARGRVRSRNLEYIKEDGTLWAFGVNNYGTFDYHLPDCTAHGVPCSSGRFHQRRWRTDFSSRIYPGRSGLWSGLRLQ